VDSKALLEVREQQITNRPRNSNTTLATAVPPVPPLPPAVPTVPSGVPPAAPPPPPALPAKDDGVPPRPKFASPPPEDDGVPPRPKFATPPPENDEIPVSSSTPAKAPVVVSPPTLRRAQSPASPARSGTPDTQGTVDEDKPIAGSASLHRSGSGEASRVRGPRVGGARGPRSPAGPASIPASSSLHNRTGSIGRGSLEGLKRSSGKVSPAPAADPRDYALKKRGGKTAPGVL